MKRLAVVSPYPPFQCGIGIYTRNLCRALGKLSDAEIVVISEGGNEQSGDIRVFNSYQRSTPFIQNILRQTDAVRPDVVHFQHAPDLFPDNRMFVDMIAKIKAGGTAVFVTLHTVYDRAKWHRFYQELAPHAHIIVHNDSCRQTMLKTLSAKPNISVIPHGTTSVKLPPKKVARDQCGIAQDSFVFLSFGMIHGMKNLHTIVLAFKKVVKRHSNAKMAVVGSPAGGRFYNKIYLRFCQTLAGRSPGFIWNNRYVTDEEALAYVSASDVMLLPYFQSYSSSSGVFHLAMGGKKPTLCSDSPKFDEIQMMAGNTSCLSLPTFNARKWSLAMAQVMEDDTLRNTLASALYEYGQQTSWETTAAKHLDIFERDGSMLSSVTGRFEPKKNSQLNLSSHELEDDNLTFG